MRQLPHESCLGLKLTGQVRVLLLQHHCPESSASGGGIQVEKSGNESLNPDTPPSKDRSRTYTADPKHAAAAQGYSNNVGENIKESQAHQRRTMVNHLIRAMPSSPHLVYQNFSKSGE